MTSATQNARGAATSKLVESLSNGDLRGVRALFSGPADIDDPFAGRHVDGGFERLVREWRPVQGATITSMETTSSTTSGSHTANEITLTLDRAGGQVELAIVVVSDFDDSDRMVKSRIYYRRAWIDGKQHHRWPVLDPQADVESNDVVQAYQAALAAGDVEGMMATFGPDFHFDGHGQAKDLHKGLGMGRYTREETHEALTQMFGIMGKGANLEHLNVIQDEKTTVLEFNLHQGVPEDPQVRAHAGVAAYELGDDGLLKEARIYDEAW